MYQIGDKIVHPMHGAGTVEDIVVRRVDGEEREYYVLRLPSGGMVVMIPVAASEKLGVRAVCDAPRAEAVLAAVETAEVAMTANWNQRYRENTQRIKSGDLDEVARVVKGLTLRERQQGLSTGERKMLHAARNILLSELMLARGASYEQTEHELDCALGRAARAEI